MLCAPGTELVFLTEGCDMPAGYQVYYLMHHKITDFLTHILHLFKVMPLSRAELNSHDLDRNYFVVKYVY
jgi:hypothetical protein